MWLICRSDLTFKSCVDMTCTLLVFLCDYVDALIYGVETSFCLYPVSDLEHEILTVCGFIYYTVDHALLSFCLVS